MAETDTDQLAPVAPPRRRPNRRLILAATAGGLALLVVGAVAGVIWVAPNTTDIRNACVAHDVVGSSGPRPGTPGGPAWQSRAPLTPEPGNPAPPPVDKPPADDESEGG